MLLKYFYLLALMLPLAIAASRRKNEDRIAGLYVKDGESGQLRFLTPTGGSNSASVNQLITQKQNLLEALRPTTTATNGITPIIVNLGGTAVTSPTLTTTGTTGNVGGSNSAILASAVAGQSPIAALLPQIVAQGALGSGTVQRRRNRRPGNRRRRRRRPAKGKRPQVFVLRPRRAQ